MTRTIRFGQLPLLALVAVFFTTGCHKDPSLVAADNSQAGAQNQATDPAANNSAPVAANSGAQAPETSYAQQGAPPPEANGSYAQTSDQGSYDPGYGEQPEYTSAQAPPPMPDYEQPPAPGDGYLWTPGYWAWGRYGYYWVPGAWVQAPYEGALWTPGYWGYRNNSYGFYPGYWGQYVGYYGGIDYGFGYVGYGYQGGYWGGGHFNYNRSFNNMNGSRAQYIYNHPVSNSQRGESRVSYNGGSGGVHVRARPAELAALHEQHTSRMAAQIQNERAASTNRAQFASVNHGRPASLAVARPLAADRNVSVPAALRSTNRAVAQRQQRQVGQQQQQQRQAAPQRQQQHRQAAPQRQAQQQRQAAPQRQAQQHRQAAPQRQAQQHRKTAPQRQAQQKHKEKKPKK